MTNDPAEILRLSPSCGCPARLPNCGGLDVGTGCYNPSPFSHPEKLATAAARITNAKAIYWTLNPVNPALLARAANRVREMNNKDPLTGDDDIVSRRWLLIDADPVRPSGISSTDAEHAMAMERITKISAMLSMEGWAGPHRRR